MSAIPEESYDDESRDIVTIREEDTYEADDTCSEIASDDQLFIGTFIPSSIRNVEVKKIDTDRQNALSRLLSSRLDKNQFESKFIRAESEKDNFFNRSTKLNALFAARPSKEKLAQINVIKEAPSNAFAAVQERLKKEKTKDKLSNLIASRPNVEQLHKMNIIQNEQKNEEKKQTFAQAKSVLGDFVLNRPTHGQLANKKIIETQSSSSSSMESSSNILTPTYVSSLSSSFISNVICSFSHTNFITNDGVILCCGSTMNGRLGNGDVNGNSDQTTPAPIESLRSLGPVTSISCGDHHNACIINGCVYTWGVGTWGRLGLGHADDCGVPTKVELDQVAVQVACGGYHTLVLTQSNQLYAFGWNKNGRLGCGKNTHSGLTMVSPILINTNINIVSIACSQNASYALTSDGKVYSWGCGAFGALGHGDEQDQWEPKLIDSLSSKHITMISAGSNHVVCYEKSTGHIYSFGQNTYKQCTSDTQTQLLVPTCMTTSSTYANITSIACGKAHTIIVNDGKAYSFGNGSRGVLGHGDEQQCSEPKHIQLSDDEYVTVASCSWNHTALVTKSGRVYTFGAPANGKLGL